MKYEIYDEGADAPVAPVRLRLEVVGDDVVVIAVDENGKRLLYGNLIRFRTDGTIERLSD